MKNFLITGGTSGIGLNCIRHIVNDHNNRILIVSRNIEKGNLIVERLKKYSKNNNVKFLQCDLSSTKNIKKLIFNNQIFKIDILVNNAGAIYWKRTLSDENIEKTFALNHMGYFTLTHFLLEKNLLKKGAKIINVASGAHWGVDLNFNDIQMIKNYNGWIAYKKSKLCNILFTRKLSNLLKSKNISVNCLHPGFVKTDFGKNNSLLFRVILSFAMKISAINVEKGTKTLLHLINNVKNETTGEYFYKEKISPSSKFSKNLNTAEMLWKESYRLLNLNISK
tara:strand:+ start:3281 stop:4120 length:840 start_codon:yes stop_codon:yes gene_type:complete